MNEIIKLPFAGTIKIGDSEIPCYVMEDGTSLLSARRMQEVLGLVERSDGKQKSGKRLDRFLNQKTLQTLFKEYFSDNDLTAIKGIGPDSRKVNAYKCSILPSICKMMINAKKEDKLVDPRQITIAKTCESLIFALAGVGLEALIHEATGYQNVRAKDALKKILDVYLKKEFATWAKKFPDEFYIEMFRLKGWDIKNPKALKRPGVVVTYTTDIVYSRLAPGILEELHNRTPKDDKGGYKVRFHQFWTDDIGHPALSQHLHTIIKFMEASTSWDSFYRMVQMALPKKNEQQLLDVFNDN